MKRDWHLTGDINDRLSIIAQSFLGIGCCSCLVVQVRDNGDDIFCNECGEIVRTENAGEVEAVMAELARADTICTARCTHSGVEAFICSECGEGLELPESVQ